MWYPLRQCMILDTVIFYSTLSPVLHSLLCSPILCTVILFAMPWLISSYWYWLAKHTFNDYLTKTRILNRLAFASIFSQSIWLSVVRGTKKKKNSLFKILWFDISPWNISVHPFTLWPPDHNSQSSAQMPSHRCVLVFYKMLSPTRNHSKFLPFCINLFCSLIFYF